MSVIGDESSQIVFNVFSFAGINKFASIDKKAGDNPVDMMNTRDAAMFWGISQRQVCRLCASGRVKSAVKVNRRWFMHPMAAKPFDRRFKKPSFRLVKVLWSNDRALYGGRSQHDCPEYTIADGLVKIIDANDCLRYMKRWGLSGGQRTVTAVA